MYDENQNLNYEPYDKHLPLSCKIVCELYFIEIILFTVTSLSILSHAREKNGYVKKALKREQISPFKKSFDLHNEFIETVARRPKSRDKTSGENQGNQRHAALSRFYRRTLGRMTMNSTRGALGHSLRSLVRSHRSLIRLLRTARFARALRCAHSFARSLTRSLRSSWESDLCL